MTSMPKFTPPDLAPLSIHVMNNSSVEDTGVDKSVTLLQEALVALVGALQTQFEAIEKTLDQNPASEASSGEGGMTQGTTSRTTKMEGASTSLYDITAEVVQLSHQAEKTLPRLTALEEQSHQSLGMIRKLISAGEEAEAELERKQKDISELADRSTSLESKVETLIPPLQSDLINVNAALQLSGQQTVSVPTPLVEVPWRAPLDERIKRLEEEIVVLQAKMRAWSEGCEQLMIKTRRENIADAVDQGHGDSRSLSMQKSTKGDGQISGTEWKEGEFVECDLGMVLNYFLSTLSEFSTTEETIRQWEVVHQLIETKIEQTVHTYIDKKLSDALRDPAQKEQALRVIHSLSPDAAYRNILTQLDFKVDKQVFHTLSTRVFEQLDGIAKLSSVQGRVLSELNNGAHRPPSAGFRATPRVSHSEMTAPQPIKSIHNSGVSRETYSQAHLRLPKPPQPPLSKDLVAPSRSSHAPASPLPARHSVPIASSTPRSSVTWAPDSALALPSPPPATHSYFGRNRGRPVSART